MDDEDPHPYHPANSLGRAPPLTEDWTRVHDILARQAERFVEPILTDEKRHCLHEIDVALKAVAEPLGYERRQIGKVSRWYLAEGNGNLPLSDVHLLATCFSEEKWDRLVDLLENVRPSFVTARGASKSRANHPFALVVVLKLLSERAALARDSVALEKAEDVVASLSGRLYSLACRGAHNFESSRKRSAPSEMAKGSYEELNRYALRLLADGISPVHLVRTIVEQVGGKFGVEDYVRRRLQGMELVPRRAKNKKPT